MPRPPGGGPKYAHASKERRGRQKERRTKKERVRHVEKGTKGFEHASGQRPGELLPAGCQQVRDDGDNDGKNEAGVPANETMATTIMRMRQADSVLGALQVRYNMCVTHSGVV